MRENTLPTHQKSPKPPKAKSLTIFNLGVIDHKIKSFQEYLKSKAYLSFTLSSMFSGAIFGTSVAVGLGLNPLGCMLFGAIAATGVLITRSLISYLVIQTITLSFVAAISMVVFRTTPDFSLEPEIFQLGYLVLVATSPLVFFVPRIKKALSSLEVPSSVQLTVSIAFAGLVVFLRSRMPNDGVFALTDMYFGEDNAGVVEVTAKSLESGYGSHVSLFGEFINAAYLAAAGSITWFGDMGELGLLPALTHYNMTLLFMAWLPLAVLSALVFSGKKFTPPITIAVVAVMTAVSALLFWPFVPLGHTSVISAGLFAMSLLALTLNRKLALEHPLLFIALITSLGLIVGNIWFPMMPFAAATVALAFLALLQVEYQKGNKKIVIALVSLFVGLGLLLLPTVLGLVFTSSDFLSLEGGTRMPGRVFTVLWFLSLPIASWRLIRLPPEKQQLGGRLFLVVLLVLTVSSVYLLVSGLLKNSGEFGYGATKYLLTAMAFTIPILWLLAVDQLRKDLTLKDLFISGIVLLGVVFAFQPDSRASLDTIIAPKSVELLHPVTNKDIQSANSGVVAALVSALSQKPDQLICVSDYGFPEEKGVENYDSYFCSRWGGSLIGDSQTLANWRFVPLERAPIDSLVDAQESVRGETVIVIRFVKQDAGGSEIPLPAETWWGEYVGEDWEITIVN
jgi:hypothetical protein